MFDSYKDIFAMRGGQYHAAMRRWPQARAEEFQRVIQLAQLQPGLELYDIPAGGGYLPRYLELPVRLSCVETTDGFIRDQGGATPAQQLLCDEISRIPRHDAAADRIISLAGIHHIHPRDALYQEFFRLLRPGGILALADVAEGSCTDGFLNEFVDRYCSLGHRGVFLEQNLAEQLQALGFVIRQDGVQGLAWRFATTQDMAEFCQLLFGLDKATPQTILAGIRDYLGYAEIQGQVLMHWELRFLQAIKPT